MEPLAIVILGRPGSGKGTQAKLLADKFCLNYFGAGEELRARQEAGDFTAQKLKKVMAEGLLAPNFIISRIWLERLEEYGKQKDFKGFVFDGSPRMLSEAKLFQEALEWYGWAERTKVFYLEISESASFDRLTKRRQCQKCGKIIPWIGGFKNMEKCADCGGDLVVRPDDNMEAIKNRLKEFNEEVVPVIEYFKEQGKLTEINGEQSIEEVFNDILKAV